MALKVDSHPTCTPHGRRGVEMVPEWPALRKSSAFAFLVQEGKTMMLLLPLSCPFRALSREGQRNSRYVLPINLPASSSVLLSLSHFFRLTIPVSAASSPSTYTGPFTRFAYHVTDLSTTTTAAYLTHTSNRDTPSLVVHVAPAAPKIRNRSHDQTKKPTYIKRQRRRDPTNRAPVPPTQPHPHYSDFIPRNHKHTSCPPPPPSHHPKPPPSHRPRQTTPPPQSCLPPTTAANSPPCPPLTPPLSPPSRHRRPTISTFGSLLVPRDVVRRVWRSICIRLMRCRIWRAIL